MFKLLHSERDVFRTSSAPDTICYTFLYRNDLYCAVAYSSIMSEWDNIVDLIKVNTSEWSAETLHKDIVGSYQTERKLGDYFKNEDYSIIDTIIKVNENNPEHAGIFPECFKFYKETKLQTINLLRQHNMSEFSNIIKNEHLS